MMSWTATWYLEASELSVSFVLTATTTPSTGGMSNRRPIWMESGSASLLLLAQYSVVTPIPNLAATLLRLSPPLTT